MHFASREVTIPATHWEEFERGEPVQVTLPDDITIEVGDTIFWSVAQHEGTCVVVEIVQPASKHIGFVRQM